MTHVIRRPGLVSGTRMAVFLALVHAVNDALTAVLGALLPTLQARLAGAIAGALVYAGRPLLIVAAQNAAPHAPAATAGIVIGVGNALAGLLYIPVGVLQGALGLAPTMAATFTLLIAAAAIAHHNLREVG